MTNTSIPATDPELQGLPEVIEAIRDEWNVPGLATAVIKDDQVILSRGFGKRSVTDNLDTTDQTLFAIGSSSKAFTAMAIAMLVDEGIVNWDEPIRRYLPAFKLYDPIATEQTTVRDLLAHRTGMPRYDLGWYNSSLSRKDLFERLQYLEPNKKFREVWQYQNLMYMTAGYLIEVLTGQTWEEFVQHHILTPLGMTATNFSTNESQQAPDFALPYREVKDEVQRMEFYNRFQAVGPAGSINSSVQDICKWLRCLLNKGRNGETTIVSEAQFAQLVAPHMVVPGEHPAFKKRPETFYYSYGLGWGITSYRGHTLVEHGGNIDGFSALVSFLPDDNIGIVTLTNLDGNLATQSVNYTLFDRLLGLEERPWSARNKQFFQGLKEQAEKAKENTLDSRVPDASLSHPLKDYTGSFEHPGLGTFTITQDGETLKGIYNDSDFTFQHLHYDVFLVTSERFEIHIKGAFVTNLDGDIESFSLPIEPEAKPIAFMRVAGKHLQAKSVLGQFCGAYEVMDQTATVAFKSEHTLSLTLPGQPTYELEPYKEDSFRVKGLSGYSVAFQRDEAGVVTQALFKQPFGTLTGTKKAEQQ
ncbi:serine hydrolase [Ktedonobacter racemifer]|uniref:Beta-lactamase n=1 Tax=Ktedonobacter racemifer DSM 44963 TaxID=485913 RepID=D6TQE4_KTERA|nr:serine hydrolase [Ktedonobacter racemifer]EFH85792.1 beta-lactamase [Ktedonobacter racemifer DSM 44963]